MKGISPIIASVLLIAITMSIAVILAAYVTNYTQQTTSAIPTACIGGAIFVEGKSCTGTTLSLDLRAEYVALSDFKVDTRTGSGIMDTGVIMQPAGISLLAGQIETYTATVTDCSTMTQFRVTTSCFNVHTDWVNK